MQHGGSGVFLNVILSTELTYRFTNMANTSDDGEQAVALTNLQKIVRQISELLMIKLKVGDVFKHVGITLYCYRRFRKLIESYKLLSCRIVLVMMH